MHVQFVHTPFLIRTPNFAVKAETKVDVFLFLFMLEPETFLIKDVFKLRGIEFHNFSK